MSVFTPSPHRLSPIYNKHTHTKNPQGFTIVELLIVIVVIAILAAISVVAYNGVQERARNTAIAETASRYVNALLMYNATYGEYPGGTDTSAVACLDGTASCWSNTNATRTATVTTALKTVMSSLPSFPNSAYNYSGSWGYYIAFLLVNTSDCPAIGGVTLINSSVSANRRTCRIALPSVS